MNAVTNMNGSTALATPPAYDPYAAYGQEAASGGAFLKFSKGEWLLGANEDEIELGRKFAANMDELSIGWIRWKDGQPAERRMGLLVQGYKPESRDALGYNDESLWDSDDDGNLKDPWNFTNELPLADPGDGEQMTFSASSKGGIGCIGNLCKSYGRERHAHPGMVPIIQLGRDSYKHKKYGKTYVPVVTIVDWVSPDGVPVHQAEAEADDDAPPAGEPAAPKTAGKTKF